MKIKSSRARLLGTVLFGTALAPATVSAALLVGYNSFKTNTPAVQAEGLLTSSLVSSAASLGGSSDGFYGPDSLGAGGFPVNSGFSLNGRIPSASGSTLTVTNSLTQTYLLTSLLFDTVRINGTGAYTLRWTSPGGSSSQTGTFSTASPINNFNDYIVNLGSIPLAPTESIVFTWAVNGVSEMDNIALIGIPEPGSLLALGCLVGSGVFLRSRSRRKVAA